MAKIISPKVEFSSLLSQMKKVAPEIFDGDGRFLNLAEGDWKFAGEPLYFVSPVDSTVLGALPMLDKDEALRAVDFAKAEFAAWSKVDLDERRRKVSDCLNLLRENVDLIAKLLMWEIGKTYKLGFTDIDRAIAGAMSPLRWLIKTSVICWKWKA